MAHTKIKGMSRAAYAAIEKLFPYERPKVTDTTEMIQRKEGQQDVLEQLKDFVYD